MDEQIYPLTFTPALRDYIWGGRRLETLYGRSLPPGIIAESWEISGHPTAPTVADDGYWKGQALPAIQEALGERLVGRFGDWALRRHKFPLLVKLLDANQDLSVQVHPDDAYARTHENGELGKTEMWYVLHADPGAELILGVRPGTTRESFRAALEAGHLETVLHRVPITSGQAVAIPAGTVHALLAGVVVTEVQQNSDTTYRVYDWGRVDAEGHERPLHVEKALDVTDWDSRPGVVAPQVVSRVGGVAVSEVVHNRYFGVEEVMLEKGSSYLGTCDGSTLEIWGCVSGEVAVEWGGRVVALPTIRYALLPAALGDFNIVARQGSRCLRVYLPEV